MVGFLCPHTILKVVFEFLTTRTLVVLFVGVFSSPTPHTFAYHDHRQIRITASAFVFLT